MPVRLVTLSAIAATVMLGACATPTSETTDGQAAEKVAAKSKTCVKTTGSNLCREPDSTQGLTEVDPDAFRNRSNSSNMMRPPISR